MKKLIFIYILAYSLFTNGQTIYKTYYGYDISPKDTIYKTYYGYDISPKDTIHALSIFINIT